MQTFSVKNIFRIRNCSGFVFSTVRKYGAYGFAKYFYLCGNATVCPIINEVCWSIKPSSTHCLVDLKQMSCSRYIATKIESI